MKNFPKDTGGPGSGLQKLKQLPDLIFFGLKRKSINGHRTYNAPKLRGIYFIDRNDGGIKETNKNARKKSEIPTEAAMPCKLRTKRRSPASRTTDDRNHRFQQNPKDTACIVEAHEFTRRRLESTLPKDYEDHITQSGAQNCSDAQAMKIPDAKAAVDKEWEKLEKLPAWQFKRVKSKKGSIWKHQEREKRKVHFGTLMDIFISKNAGVRTEVSKVQRQGRAPR